MKKKILFIFFIFLCVFSLMNGENWDYFRNKQGFNFATKKYKIIPDATVYDNNGTVIGRIKSNNTFESSKVAFVQDESVQPFDIFAYFIAYDNGWISTDNIFLDGSEVFSDSIVTYNKFRHEKSWIPAWYNSLLTSDKKIENYSEIYEGFGFKAREEFALTDTHKIIINNTLLIFQSILGSDYYFSIKKIEKKNTIFYVQCEIGECFQTDYYAFNRIWERESFANLPDLTENRNCTFIIEQNGNRLRLYNGENYKLIIELMQTDNNWNNSMLKYIESDYKNKPSNLNPIEEELDHPWSDPKTGLYEGTFDAKSLVAVQSTNVTPNKTMLVSENLKLRSGEATSTQVITVMFAGTKVKILELGKAENIDGINSNWVKVEVQKGAKDRDGNPIKAGTIGWCYGGYLK